MITVRPHMKILITPETFNRLHCLRGEKKFLEESFHPGAPTEKIRVESERRVNDFLDDAILLLQRGAEKHDLFTRARKLIRTFDKEDTEEREKVGDYIGGTMRIIGIEDWTEHL